MLPKVIIHNEVSLNGYITGFDSNMNTYYEIAGRFNPDAVLVGSNTAKVGIELDYGDLTHSPEEEKSDFVKPEISPEDKRPFLVIPDSSGILENLLHVYRRLEYIKDVIVLVSNKTAGHYNEYLQKRQYDMIKVGEDHVDYRRAFEVLCDRYNVKTIRSDSGGTLNTILIEQDLVDEISLLISPVLVSKNNIALFVDLHLENGNKIIDLELIKNEVIDNNYLWLVYKVSKKQY